MTKEEVIAMAREAGFTVGPSRDGPDDVWGVASTLEHFAKLVRDDYSYTHASLWLTRIKGAVEAERQAKEIEALQLELDGAHSELRRQARHKAGAPPETHKPWVGLTPEDYDSMRPRVPYVVNDFTFADVAAIVEDKLKEKNNG